MGILVSTMKLVGIALALVAGAHGQGVQEQIKKAIEAKIQTCDLATPHYNNKPTWEGVIIDHGLTKAEAQAIVDNVKANNEKIYSGYTEAQIITFKELSEKFADDELLAKFAAALGK